MRRATPKLGRAFTLAESLMAATILAMAISAVTIPFTAGARNEQVDARRTIASSLASGIMEEILAKPFADPDGAGDVGPEYDEVSRSDFDNIDDYHGYEEEPGAIRSSGGAIVSDPAATGLSRHVSCEYVYVSGQDGESDPTFIRITVEIRYKDSPTITLTRLSYKT